MIEVKYKARLGNNLFQYCLGRVLAEELGFTLRAEALSGFPRTQETVHGESHLEPVQVLTGHRIDLEATLRDSRRRRVVLEGWFQRYEYYRPYRARIRSWLQLDPSLAPSCSVPDLVVNVRRTDYVALGWALPYSYYATAIDHALPRGGSLGIVTDDADDPFFRRFRRWNPALVSASPLRDLALMLRAPRLVLSQSTFSWWAAFLGVATEIVAPDPSFGIWRPHSGEDSANLIERDRFTCLPCREEYVPSRRERAYQRWRTLKRRLILKLNRDFHCALSVPGP